MAKANDFGVGLMHENAITASKVGWEPEDFSNFSKDENLMRLVLGVVRGTHEIKGIDHIIDCNADPFIPDGWKVEEHQKGGNSTFDASKVELYLSKKQRSGSIEGNKLREELKGKKVLNANVLDYLLANPKVIPKEWNGKAIFFWGTIYRDSDGSLCVRFLRWGGAGWYWGSGWLGLGFNGGYPAALAS